MSDPIMTFGVSNDTWAALSSIFTGVSAIGTLWAVRVALKLAKDGTVPRIEIRSIYAETTLKVIVTATNTGCVPVTITGLTYSLTGNKAKKHTLAWPKVNSLCVDPEFVTMVTPLPQKIERGDRARIIVELESLLPILNLLVHTLRKSRLPKGAVRLWTLRRVRLGFVSYEGVHWAPLGKSLKELVWNRVMAEENSDPSGVV